MVEFKNVNKYFGKIQVLKNLNLLVQKGENVTILGPSGSGKSTLLRCINQLEKIQSGEISVDGERINEKVDVTRLREKIGFVFQSYNLFPHLTVQQNVTLALRHIKKLPKKAADEIAYEVLSKVRVQDKLHSYPLELSGGQQQRTAIARALAMNPPIMLFDEITSALDPELIGEVLDVLRELSRSGKTMIIVTHEIGFAREVSDRVIFFDEGCVIEEGDPDNVLDHPKTERARTFFVKVLK